MVRLPPHTPGMRIGLFGGTFDPPHAAHRAACLIALNRLGLDRVWWMVTPGNPLKDTRGLAPLDERIRAASELASHPRIDVTGFEADIGTGYTFQTVRYLRRHCPGVRFVWIMGADNLRSFHRWQNWRGIAAMHADCGDRPSGAEPLRDRQHRRPGACAGPYSGDGRPLAPGPDTAGLGLSARPEVAALLDRTARITGRS